MINIKFSEKEKQIFDYYRFHHPHPRVQKKMEALWLKSQELPHSLICQLTNISPNTLRTYLKEYQQGGIEKLKKVRFYQPKSELQQHKLLLKEHFRSCPPASINEAISEIEKLTGIKRSPTQVRIFLKSLGMKFLKVGSLPSKAFSVQKDYQKKTRTRT